MEAIDKRKSKMKALQEQTSVTIALLAYISLFDLLFQSGEQLRAEEFLNSNTLSITKLLTAEMVALLLCPLSTSFMVDRVAPPMLIT